MWSSRLIAVIALGAACAPLAAQGGARSGSVTAAPDTSEHARDPGRPGETQLVIDTTGFAARSSRTDSLAAALRDSAPPDTVPPPPFALADAGVAVPPGTGRGEVTLPSGVVVDAFGRLWVTDESLHRLQRFEPDGAWSAEAGGLGSDPGQLRRPGSVALHGSSSLAVLDTENRRVVVYDLFGRFLGVLVDFTALAEVGGTPGRVDPLAIATDRGGALFVADADRERVALFDVSGAPTGQIGGFGAKAGAFRGLAALAVSPRGEVVTAENVNARVQVLDGGGRVLRSWPLEPRPGRGRLAVAVSDSGRVAVADEAGGRVWLFGADGRTLAVRAGLKGPRALAFAPGGILLVAEGRGPRVVRLRIVPAPPRER